MQVDIQFYNRKDQPTGKVQFVGDTLPEIEREVEYYIDAFLSPGSYAERVDS